MTRPYFSVWLVILLLSWIAIKARQSSKTTRLIDELLATLDAQETALQEAQERIHFLEHEIEIAVAISARLEDSLTRRFASVYSLEIDRQPEYLKTEEAPKRKPFLFTQVIGNEAYRYRDGVLVSCEELHNKDTAHPQDPNEE